MENQVNDRLGAILLDLTFLAIPVAFALCGLMLALGLGLLLN